MTRAHLDGIHAYLSGTGYHVPERVVTNDELAGLMDTSDEWIQARTGIVTRRFAAEGEGVADLAIPAVEQALRAAALTVADIDLIIFATTTPDYSAPGSGCLIQERMGFGEIGALDIRVQCSGFVYGLSIADQYIRTGTYRHILLIGAEVQSTGMNLSDDGRDVSIIFGDGAGAVILSATKEDRGILSSHLHAQGKYAKDLWLELPSSRRNPRVSHEDLDAGRQWLKMNGKEVFRHAVVRFPQVIREALDANNLSIEDIALIVPHQANLRISQEVSRRLNAPEELLYSNIHKYGNTTAASIPIALAEAIAEGKIKPGDLVIFAAFGSGFTWASALVKW
ncbi:MAG: ketoacyl-ACP synthase III [Candidatus Marinimicrobia bacterium]|nr:ketoacyl-ACP synthase III [Candidatus Neomarinimicrobiota bacterium]MCH7858263.1 ketoacyl-ACP synthase III [Candidatus Neomarinimicrobiota bacterium]